MNQKILILGIQGMLGHKLFGYLSEKPDYLVYGTIRKNDITGNNIFQNIDAFSIQDIENLVKQVKPDIVINCIGIIKQSLQVKSPKLSVYINSYFPHLVNEVCKIYNCRLIHISTDCVFDGKDGFYKEEDNPAPVDLYGRSKLLGEVIDENSLTIRTSMIGHELNTKHGLLEWFLSQNQNVKGFKNAVFSGFTTLELARIISVYILTNPDLCGLYQIAADPIDKFSLLNIIKDVYKKEIKIIPDEEFKCNRALNAERFNRLTGYVPPKWDKMIKDMYNDQNQT